MAHIGVLEHLDRLSLEPELVTGTSMGALVGALNGLIVVFVVGSEILRRRQVRRVERTLEAASTPVSEEEQG